MYQYDVDELPPDLLSFSTSLLTKYDINHSISTSHTLLPICINDNNRLADEIVLMQLVHNFAHLTRLQVYCVPHLVIL